jgi:hypothetical protein
MAMFHKGDIVTLADGSQGTVEGVVQTEIKNIYRISVGENDDRYFEEDKLKLFRKKPRTPLWQKLAALAATLFHFG